MFVLFPKRTISNRPAASHTTKINLAADEFLKRGLIEGAITACTQGTTSWAERSEPQGRRTESLYYLIANRWQESRPTDTNKVMPTKSVFLYFHPEAAHRRATYPRVSRSAAHKTQKGSSSISKAR